MEIKKNPDYDLSRRSLLFFQLGMIIMLFLTWQLLEWKTYDRSDLETGQIEVADALDEIIPITEQINTPPPPPAPSITPLVILEVENESEIEESVIESTETNQNDKILEIEEIAEEVVEEEIVNVPFAVIEDVPVYPGCESANNNEARKECMSKKIEEFVKKNFDTELASELGLEGRQRIFVTFKIDKNGDVVDVRARAPHIKLEEEAVKIVKSLPHMTPGEQRGVPVGVLYGLPIVFQVEN